MKDSKHFTFPVNISGRYFRPQDTTNVGVPFFLGSLQAGLRWQATVQNADDPSFLGTVWGQAMLSGTLAGTSKMRSVFGAAAGAGLVDFEFDAGISLAKNSNFKISVYRIVTDYGINSFQKTVFKAGLDLAPPK